MSVEPVLSVIDRDPDCTRWLRTTKRVPVVRHLDPVDAAPDAPVLVLARASELAEVAPLARNANAHHRLRGLLVHADVDPAWLGQLLDRAGLRTVQRLLVHRGPRLVQRVIEAWKHGSQDVLIADAIALPHSLLVVTCALERIEVPWAAGAALRAVPTRERGRIEIAEDGSYIHWPWVDVHLDVEALRIMVDPAARQRALVDQVRHMRAIGEAIATLRARAGLRQSDVPGLSPRQVRRIEAGEVVPRASSLAKLAGAHGMPANGYLDALARVVHGGRAAAPRRRPGNHDGR